MATKIAFFRLLFASSAFWSSSIAVLGQLAVAPSFFFLCQYHKDGQAPDSLPHAQASISIDIEGHHDYYVPGQSYLVNVESSVDFDGFMMIGLFTEPSGPQSTLFSLPMSFGSVGGQLSPAGRTMCSIVHSHLTGGKPSRSLRFIWMAPPTGTGCVNFLATATLGQNVLFKDTLALQICPEGSDTNSSMLSYSGLHDYPGLVVRDDFEASNVVNTDIWLSHDGGLIGHECGSIASGQALVFCSDNATLISNRWNTTSATTLEFVIGLGNCTNSNGSLDVGIYFAKDSCDDWKLMEIIEVNRDSNVVVLELPSSSKSQDVCFKWSSDALNPGRLEDSCWAVDNVFVANSQSLPDYLYDNFDPVDPSNFIFFSTGSVQRKCGSTGNALVFGHRRVKGHQIVVTRDLETHFSYNPRDIIFRELFDGSLSNEWLLSGGSLTSCDPSDVGGILVMEQTPSSGSSRKFCTPFINATEAYNLRFKIKKGGCHSWNNTVSNERLEITISAETEKGETTFLNFQNFYRADQLFHESSVLIPSKGRSNVTRFCMTDSEQTSSTGSAWSVDDLLILPWRSSSAEDILSVGDQQLVFQLSLNVGCTSGKTLNSLASGVKILFEFSIDYGRHWQLLHSLCLPPSCRGQQSAINSLSTAADGPKGWLRHIFALPYAAMGSAVRFRIRAHGRGQWALDDLFIGKCAFGCWGHGFCHESGCRCDPGYTGPFCENLGLKITSLRETFNYPLTVTSPVQTTGGVVGFHCGIVSRDKAMVFNRAGPRELITVEMNSNSTLYLQFKVHLGTVSSASRNKCPAMTDRSEAVHVHFSCNGKLDWSPLKTLTFQDPGFGTSLVTVSLPRESRKSSCYFKIWQPRHSGSGLDVWAIDDLYLTPYLRDVIAEDFDSFDANGQSGNVLLNYKDGLLQEYCQSRNLSLVLHDISSFVELGEITINTQYTLQFDLVIGSNCKSSRSATKSKGFEILVEFSVDSGNTWYLIYDPCVRGHLRSVNKYARSVVNSQTCLRGQSVVGTVYHAHDFATWRRVTIPLPKKTVSENAKVRFRSKSSSLSSNEVVWAVDNIYVGPSCAEFCNGHGRCIDRGTCLCDDGFYGATCPLEKLAKKKFRSRNISKRSLKNDGFELNGADVATADRRCANRLVSDSPILFFEAL